MAAFVPVSIDNNFNLAAGSNTVVLHTAPANRGSKIVSALAAYTGTFTGVTLQLFAAGAPAGEVKTVLVSGDLINLLDPGKEIFVPTGASFVIQVEGATLNDTLRRVGNVEDHLA